MSDSDDNAPGQPRAPQDALPVAEPMPAEDVLAGTDYEIVNLVGHGSRSRVYCARHRGLGHLVAIKVLDAIRAPSRRQRDRVRLEGQIGARVRHPNLVAVHHAGRTAAGAPYLAMELLEGESLQERLDDVQGSLPLRQALDISCQVLAGLGAMHEAGLVHRDIKPANVFLCSDGSVKVLDLGFAKVVTRAGPLTPEALADATDAGVLVGSPRYMAPEQALARTVDAQADIYAVACVLYRCLCGRGPFDAFRTLPELRRALISETPAAPSHDCPYALPRELDALILRCLRKDPHTRPASAASVAMELCDIERRLCAELQRRGDGFRGKGPGADGSGAGGSGADGSGAGGSGADGSGAGGSGAGGSGAGGSGANDGSDANGPSANERGGRWISRLSLCRVVLALTCMTIGALITALAVALKSP